MAREYLFRALPHPPPPTIGHTAAAKNILCTYLGCERNIIIPTFSGAVHQLLCHILRISTLTSRGKRCKRLPTHCATDAPVPLPSYIPIGLPLILRHPFHPPRVTAPNSLPCVGCHRHGHPISNATPQKPCPDVSNSGDDITPLN